MEVRNQAHEAGKNWKPPPQFRPAGAAPQPSPNHLKQWLHKDRRKNTLEKWNGSYTNKVLIVKHWRIIFFSFPWLSQTLQVFHVSLKIFVTTTTPYSQNTWKKIYIQERENIQWFSSQNTAGVWIPQKE